MENLRIHSSTVVLYPCEDSNLGTVKVKHLMCKQSDGTYIYKVGIGSDDWILSYGLTIPAGNDYEI